MDDLVIEGSFKMSKDLGVNWLELNQIIAAIPQDWKVMLVHTQGPARKSLYSELYNRKERNRMIYDRLIENNMTLSKYHKRWKDAEGVVFSEDNYDTAFAKYTQVTGITKYRDFQYRLLLCTIFTNVEFHKWGLTTSDSCYFCQESIEYRCHIFFECTHIKPLLDVITELCSVNNIEIILTMENILLSNLHKKLPHIINFICTVMKQLIYRCKCVKKVVNKQIFQHEILYLHNIDHTLSLREGKM